VPLLVLGPSTKNAGFACIGSVSELLDDLEHSSESDVFELVGERYEGLVHLLELVGKEDVEYSPCGGFEVFRNSEVELAKNCEERFPYFNKTLKSISGLDETFTLAPEKINQSRLQDIKTCIANHAEGKLNPGSNFLMALRCPKLKSQQRVLSLNWLMVG